MSLTEVELLRQFLSDRLVGPACRPTSSRTLGSGFIALLNSQTLRVVSNHEASLTTVLETLLLQLIMVMMLLGAIRHRRHRRWLCRHRHHGHHDSPGRRLIIYRRHHHERAQGRDHAEIGPCGSLIKIISPRVSFH